MYCELEQLDNGRWQCTRRCGQPTMGGNYKRRCNADRPDKADLMEQQAIHDAAEQLGITDLTTHYIVAIKTWLAAGRPVRTDKECQDLYEQHCTPCEHLRRDKGFFGWLRGTYCGLCGCRVGTKKFALANKLKMATEPCPDGKFLAKYQTYEPPDTNTVVVAARKGTGTELRKLLRYLKLGTSVKCNCAEKEVEMNRRGPQWCRDNMELIVDWLEDLAAPREVDRDVGRRMVLIAIRRAERQLRRTRELEAIQV